ncbi:MAG: XisI protein [Anaerolineae bacterium]|nr:XisI protein [Anaerolineae bacterium]
MDTIEIYKKAVQNLILDYADLKPSHGEIDTEAIIDWEKGHFEVLHVGWDGQRRVHGVLIHIDVIGDKVWIQQDGTSPGVAEELVVAGIPRENIVLGFRPAHLRQHTGFATA